MKEIKSEALKELHTILFNAEPDWNDDKINTLYRFYAGNETRSSLHKYVNLVSFKEFKSNVMSILKELNGEAC